MRQSYFLCFPSFSLSNLLLPAADHFVWKLKSLQCGVRKYKTIKHQSFVITVCELVRRMSKNVMRKNVMFNTWS